MKRILNKESRAAIELMIANNLITKDIAEKYFPELRESKDERIRKALIRYFTLSDEHAYNEACGVSYKDILAWLEKQGEQKPVEPQQDMLSQEQYAKVVDECIYGEQKTNPCDGCVNRKGCINCENGELRETEQKPAWSEEDEKMLRTIISDGIRGAELDKAQTDWLKSLKERYTWEPSELQIEALAIAIRCGIKLGTWEEEALKDLIEQLKKLREE